MPTKKKPAKKKARSRRSTVETEVGHIVELTDTQVKTLVELNNQLASIRSNTGILQLEHLKKMRSLLDEAILMEEKLRSSIHRFGRTKKINMNVDGHNWRVDFSKKHIIRTK